MPIAPDWIQPYVQVFFDLLPMKNGQGWIPFTEVRSYAECYGWDTCELFEVLQQMNIAYIQKEVEHSAK